MRIPPTYIVTQEMISVLSQIEANRHIISSFKPNNELIKKIQRISYLKSSVYSARIEGNPLTVEEWEHSSEINKKKEIMNIISAMQYLKSKDQITITKDLILNLHEIVGKELFPDTGQWRKEMGAIFNQAGVAVYVSPAPERIKGLITQLLSYINGNTEQFPLITALLSHLIFEKIHPFIDGNGRVGRLLMIAILKSKRYEFNPPIAIEEYLDSNKDMYYYHLDNGIKNTNEYLMFMFKAFFQGTESVKKLLEEEQNKNRNLILPPRQEEIYLIIKEHRMVSFNFIQRRFLKIPGRTLRYDLKKLAEKKLIIKTGKTKGVWYSIK
jgi:Fic family protein